MISVKDNIREVMSFTERLGSQYRFAVAKALTETARQAAREDVPRQVEQDLDNPTPFTKSGFFYTPARKENLVAVVGAKDKQAEYLRFQIYGGDRYPRRKALKLPGEVKLDQYGNIPRRDLKRLIAEAKRVRKANRVAGGKTSYKGRSKGIFYGQPKNRPELPPGIYRRVETTTARLIVPIVLFPTGVASYRPRFNMRAAVETAVRTRFVPNLRRAVALARATAR